MLIPPMQDSKEADIKDINEKMLHGPVDSLYVLSEAMSDTHTSYH